MSFDRFGYDLSGLAEFCQVWPRFGRGLAEVWQRFGRFPEVWQVWLRYGRFGLALTGLAGLEGWLRFGSFG